MPDVLAVLVLSVAEVVPEESEVDAALATVVVVVEPSALVVTSTIEPSGRYSVTVDALDELDEPDEPEAPEASLSALLGGGPSMVPSCIAVCSWLSVMLPLPEVSILLKIASA